MFKRTDAKVALTLCAMLASAGVVMASEPTPSLTMDSTLVTLDDAPARAPLMAGLDKLGAAKTLDSIGLNIYGWVEGGYTYNHRDHGTPIAPGPFNHEKGNHFMGNQLDLRFERDVDLKKWDVGGLIEVLYGTDANAIHSGGLGYNGNDNSTFATDDRYHPQFQFDIPQAYVDVAIPVGNGLKIRAGKFVTIYSLETIAPGTTLAGGSSPFYSHSYVFNALPFTHTGIMAFYTLNDQWAVAGGITRGWDVATEDNNGAIDGLAQVTWTPNKKLTATLNMGTGPENGAEGAEFSDNSHYRTVVNPVIVYNMTDKLSFGMDGLYIYDGGYRGFAGNTHAYGDRWGAAFYAAYMINDMFTLNGRIEKMHDNVVNSNFAQNFYEATVGVTITPLTDAIGKNLSIRPEVRYDFSDSGPANKPYSANGTFYKDQLTFGADVIFRF